MKSNLISPNSLTPRQLLSYENGSYYRFEYQFSDIADCYEVNVKAYLGNSSRPFIKWNSTVYDDWKMLEETTVKKLVENFTWERCDLMREIHHYRKALVEFNGGLSIYENFTAKTLEYIRLVSERILRTLFEAAFEEETAEVIIEEVD